MFYKGVKGAVSIPTNDLVRPIRHFKPPLLILSSFFPQTIRDWNSLTDSLLSAAECAEDSVAKFISLARARD